MRSLFLVALAMVMATGCSGGDVRKDGDSEPPAWTKQPTRTVDAGYIIYVGSGEDATSDRARFKAESMAFQDLANECSFAPKGARVEDRFDQSAGVLHRAFAKVAVEFQDCEAARAAVTPEKIRLLANSTITDQLKNYREMIDTPEPAETIAAATGPELPTQAPPPVRSTTDWVVARQRVVFYKEVVILAPPAMYPPSAPQTVQPVPAVVAQNQSIQSFVSTHPQIASAQASNTVFSTLRPNSYAHRPEALREGRRAPVSGMSQASSSPKPQRAQRTGKGRGTNRGRGRGKRKKRGGENY